MTLGAFEEASPAAFRGVGLHKLEMPTKAIMASNRKAGVEGGFIWVMLMSVKSFLVGRFARCEHAARGSDTIHDTTVVPESLPIRPMFHSP